MTTQTIGPRAPVFTPSGNSRLDSMFSFNPDGSYKPATTFDPYGNDWTWEQVTQSDQGAPIGWSNAEETRRQAIDNAYYSLQSSQGKNTSFADPSSPPKTLGADVMSSLAAYGDWMDKSAGNDIVSATIDPASGHIMVNSSNGGDGHNPIFIYDQSGNYLGQQVGSKQFGALKGVGMVAGAALTMGALGAAAAAGEAGMAGAGAGAGAGAAGAGSGALGAGAAGSSFGGIGAGAAGSGFGFGTLGELGVGGASTFGSAGAGGLLGGGAALGAAGAASAGGAGGSTASLTGGFDGPLPAGSGFSGANTALPELGVGATPFGSSGLGLDGASSVLGSAGSAGGSFLDSLSTKDLLGLGTSALGAIGGSQGTKTTNTSSAQLPAFLQGPVAQDLIPRTQGLLNTQMPLAQQAGQQLTTAGSGLLNAPIAGNGVGQVKLNAPTTNTNPYLAGMAGDMQRRTQMLLGQNNLQTQGHAVGVGGLGGSRQGVAQGIAAGQAADSLQGQLAGLYGSAYNNDQNRALQQYGMDQSFYGQQRGQDLSGASIGAGMLSQGISMPFAPLKDTANIYQPFTGFGTTTGVQSAGGGALGALGGALGGAQLAKNLGLFGSAV